MGTTETETQPWSSTSTSWDQIGQKDPWGLPPSGDSPWSSVLDPWTSDHYSKPTSLPKQKPKPTHVTKAKEKVFTIDEDGVKTLVQAKKEAKRLKEELSHSQGNLLGRRHLLRLPRQTQQ
jgi:hypothetical protein